MALSPHGGTAGSWEEGARRRLDRLSAALWGGVCVYLYLSSNLYLYIYIYTHSFVYVYIYVGIMYVYIYIYIYVCVCVYVYVYVYTYKFSSKLPVTTFVAEFYGMLPCAIV